MAAVRSSQLRERLLERGLSPRSANEYLKAIRHAEAWLEQRGTSLRTCSGDELARYVATRPRSWSTRKTMRSAFGHYWAIVGRRRPPMWAVPVPRKPRMRCRAVSELEAWKLDQVARARGDLKGLAVLLGLYLGLRLSEIAAFRWGDVDADGWLRVLGKGGTDCELPVHPVVLDALAALPKPSPWAFPGRWGGPAHPTTIWGWIKQVAAEAGMPAVTPHQLRHTCLATANDVTRDLRATQEFARHARPETTAGYTRAGGRRLKAVMQALDFAAVAAAAELEVA